jgi:peptidoglycan/xylan/chitin deacetylase (PgdA/CDA1 family)
MTADELRALAQDRLVSIGSHTVAHANLLECGPNRVAMELTQSKTQLERVLGRPIDFFSYPFGARSATVDQKASEAGYRRIFSSDPAWAFQSPSQFLCGRVSVDPDISVLEFRLKILGAYRWQSWLRSMTTDP